MHPWEIQACGVKAEHSTNDHLICRIFKAFLQGKILPQTKGDE
jgi:hypothetical protein